MLAPEIDKVYNVLNICMEIQNKIYKKEKNEIFSQFHIYKKISGKTFRYCLIFNFYSIRAKRLILTLTYSGPWVHPQKEHTEFVSGTSKK